MIFPLVLICHRNRQESYWRNELDWSLDFRLRIHIVSDEKELIDYINEFETYHINEIIKLQETWTNLETDFPGYYALSLTNGYQDFCSFCIDDIDDQILDKNCLSDNLNENLEEYQTNWLPIKVRINKFLSQSKSLIEQKVKANIIAKEQKKLVQQKQNEEKREQAERLEYQRLKAKYDSDISSR